jgi:hypothetical protein
MSTKKPIVVGGANGVRRTTLTDEYVARRRVDDVGAGAKTHKIIALQNQDEREHEI